MYLRVICTALALDTVASLQAVVSQAIAIKRGECKPWCRADQCHLKMMCACDFCQTSEDEDDSYTVGNEEEPEEDEETPPAPMTYYPESKPYGPHYFSKDETLPSWYGLQCKGHCLKGWSAKKCGFAACSGCMKQENGDGCDIPKYVSGKKNVLLIMADDLNVDVETYRYGHPQAHTPSIKKLSESGTRFDHAYAVHPLCMPSRATFMTGIYGINSENMFSAKYYENPLLKKSRTFVEMFKLNGYYTVGTGKLGHSEKPMVACFIFTESAPLRLRLAQRPKLFRSIESAGLSAL